MAGLFLFLILSTSSSPIFSYSWLGILLGSTAVRAVLANYFNVEENDRFDVEKTSWFLILGAAWSGIIWGNSWFLLPTSPSLIEVSAVGLWLAGMLAGAATTMTVIRSVFLAFAIPASSIFIVYNLINTSGDTFVLFGGFVMYIGFITPIAIRVGKDFNRTIELQINNKTLEETLLLEAVRLKAKERELAEEKRQTQKLLTEKKNTDEQLKSAAEDRLLLLEAVGEGIFGVSNRGNVTFINTRALKMLSLDESDIINQSALRLISATSKESTANIAAYNAITRCFQKGEPAINMEGYLTGFGGIELPVRFSCTPILKDTAVVGSVVSFVDVSKQKEMESMLLQSQKMQAIGRLTGGVSHDFNNLLTVIMGNLQFLKKRLSNDEKAQRLADKVMQAAKNGADLNNRLLSFSREQALKSDVFYIGELIADMHEFIDRLLGEDVILSLRIECGEKAVAIDKTQLQNAILNLGVNAKDAMTNGGYFTIALKNAWLDSSFARTENKEAGKEFVELTFTDTGSGIPEEIQEKIFEPFFSTKDSTRGTGLGLSTVYGFIRQSGGTITLSSAIDAGSAFSLFLPVSDEIPSDENLEKTEDSEFDSTGVILVVEDDNEVREVAIQALESAGYTVLSAINGRDGLAVAKRHREIQLVFSDVVMPGGMSGIDMAEKLLEHRPDLPILLATGYTEQSNKNRMIEEENVVIIAKPYDTQTLPNMVASMISTAVNKPSITVK